jgi:hypothetical protein
MRRLASLQTELPLSSRVRYIFEACRRSLPFVIHQQQVFLSV